MANPAAGDEEISTKCKQLLESPVENANHVPFLLAAMSSLDCEVMQKLVVETMGQFFIGAIERGELVVAEQSKIGRLPNGPEKTYVKWILRQYNSFKNLLLGLLGSTHSWAPQVSAFSVLMDLIGGEYVAEVSRMGYSELCDHLILTPEIPPEVLSMWMSKYFSYADIRYYTLLAVDRTATKHKKQPDSHLSTTLYDVLANLPASYEACKTEDGTVRSWCGASEVGVSTQAISSADKTRRKRLKRQMDLGLVPQTSDMKPASWFCEKTQCAAFSSAWLSFLQLGLSDDLLVRLLSYIPHGVIPHMKDPQMLCDFLTAALDSGGYVGVLALNGLFILVTKHGLEYPGFYKRLYGLLHPDVFYLKQRVEFWRLVNRFLASGHVPAYTAGAFIKKLSRLSIEAPPHGAMTCISFIHNLLRRHPSCNVLVHQPKPSKHSQTLGGSDLIMNDPYDETAEDPAESRATESSLWELEILRNHTCPQVANYATMFDKDLTKKRKTADADISLALAASYTSLFYEGLQKRVKTVPIEIHEAPPTKLFEENWWDAV